MDEKIIALKIKELRTTMNFTQKEFGDFINVAQTTLSSYENVTKSPNIDTLCNIADKCNVSLDWLCGRSDLKSNTPTTYADFFNLLIDLANTESDPLEIVYVKYVNLAAIVFKDSIINKFLIDYLKMRNLKNEGVIDDEMLQTWLNGKIESQKNNTVDIYSHDEDIISSVNIFISANDEY